MVTPAEKCEVLDAWIRRALVRLEAVDQAAYRAPWWVDTAYGGIDGWQIRATVPGPDERPKPREAVIVGAGREGDGGVWERADADAITLSRSLLAATVSTLRTTLDGLAKWPHRLVGGSGDMTCPRFALPNGRLIHHLRYPDEDTVPCLCGLDTRRLEILRHLTRGFAAVFPDELLPHAALDPDERTAP